MKVIDIQPYRVKREIKRLEDRVCKLAQESNAGAIRELKTCFKLWLKHSQTG